MNAPLAFCPRCRKEVVFTETGNLRKCAVCGLEFRRSDSSRPELDAVGAVLMTVGHVILRVVLILGIIVLVGIATLFASCALH
jgi:uncharacterized protein (DUF983 family)